MAHLKVVQQASAVWGKWLIGQRSFVDDSVIFEITRTTPMLTCTTEARGVARVICCVSGVEKNLGVELGIVTAICGEREQGWQCSDRT